MRRLLLAPLLAQALVSIAVSAAPGDRRAGLLPATVPPPIVVTSTADRTTVAVGERVTVVYSARIPEGATLKLESLVPPPGPKGSPPPRASSSISSPWPLLPWRRRREPASSTSGRR